MIRFTIALTVFAIALCAMIVMQPRGPQSEVVSRSAASPAPITAPVASGPAAEPEPVAAPLPTPAATTAELPDVSTPDALRIALVQAIAEGRDKDHLRALVAEAARHGAVRPNQTLITARGRIDVDDYLPEGFVAPGSIPAATAPTASRPGPATGTYHTVEPGDTLRTLSERFYGTPNDYLRIFDANRVHLVTPNDLRVGVTLFIPD